ncbi:NAD-aldehyde dehydrogenase [Tricholoma matsutake]|nr:NAD-aldehyde dehydrogenase [Tricholoma matsutake 945]
MVDLEYTPVEEIDKHYAALRAGFNSGKFKSIAYRKYQLLQLAYLIRDNEKRFVEALASDLGKPALESYSLEINPTLDDVKLAWESVEKWARPEKPSFSIKFAALRPIIYKEPIGVVLIISPFNYPLWLTIPILAGAIAAGCPLLLKPSESAPATAALLAELMPKYMDMDLVRIVNGAIPQTTKLLSLQWDRIFYTGIGRVGKIVAQAAAKFLTPVTLELGGKSPVFIDPKSDLQLAARRILWGKFANAGQTCVAPDYVLVPKSCQDKFVEALKVVYESFFPESAKPSSPGTFGRLATPQAFQRVKGLLDNTKGKVVLGGDTDEAAKYIAPTVVSDVHPDDSLMSEEIFGPVLPIVPVEDVDEAVAFVNAHDHPLALYVFSRDEEYKKKGAVSTRSGAAIANDLIIHLGVDGLPFGGIGPSGNGVHTGKFTFDLFTQLRSSIDSPSWLDKIMGYRFPPFTDGKIKTAGLLAPSLPARPTGPPCTMATRSKWWRKWFILAILVIVGLTRRMNMISRR